MEQTAIAGRILLGWDRFVASSSMSMRTTSKLSKALIGVLCLYLLSYAFARATVFHTVERYSGTEGKGGARQDYIAKRDRPAGDGWEYYVFLPAIKMEEKLVNVFHSLSR